MQLLTSIVLKVISRQAQIRLLKKLKKVNNDVFSKFNFVLDRLKVKEYHKLVYGKIPSKTFNSPRSKRQKVIGISNNIPLKFSSRKQCNRNFRTVRKIKSPFINGIDMKELQKELKNADKINSTFYRNSLSKRNMEYARKYLDLYRDNQTRKKV